jgi:hypothetical protein
LLESRSSPVSRSFAIVDEASVAKDASRLVTVVVASVVRPVTTALVVVELPMIAFVMFVSVAMMVAKNPVDAVIPVVEALPSVVCPVTLSTPPMLVLPETVKLVDDALQR